MGDVVGPSRYVIIVLPAANVSVWRIGRTQLNVMHLAHVRSDEKLDDLDIEQVCESLARLIRSSGRLRLMTKYVSTFVVKESIVYFMLYRNIVTLQVYTQRIG